jgi:hypothetical protein
LLHIIVGKVRRVEGAVGFFIFCAHSYEAVKNA